MILHSLRGGTLTSFWNYRSSVFRYRFELKIKNILMTKRNIGQRVLVVVTVTFNFVAYNFYLSFSSLIKNIFKNMNYFLLM